LKTWVLSDGTIRLALEGLVFWMMEQLDGLDGSEICSVLGSVGKLFVTACDGVWRIICERDESNHAPDELPPVLPHELCQICMREFVRRLQGHSMRLLALFGADGMDDISNEFAEFQRALREDPLLQEAIVKNSANHVSFRFLNNS
jgi:hypothetical protein